MITLNLNRIIQDWYRNNEEYNKIKDILGIDWFKGTNGFKSYLISILDRVYKYHNAYNELLWDTYNANLLPVYKAGFIDLNKQYLTIGINGLNQAAEFLGIDCTDNKEYSKFCQSIFSTIQEQNKLHKTKKCTFNTECVPRRSGHIKPLVIDLKLLVIGQQGASKEILCSLRD